MQQSSTKTTGCVCICICVGVVFVLVVWFHRNGLLFDVVLKKILFVVVVAWCCLVFLFGFVALHHWRAGDGSGEAESKIPEIPISVFCFDMLS